MGGVLTQLIKGKWHLIAYCSQSLSPIKRNYKIHDQELLAIMRALEDNKDIVLLDPKLFIGTIELDTLDEDLLRHIRALAGDIEDSVQKSLLARPREWERDGDLVMREGRIYVPRDATLRGDIIRAHHDTRIAGHPGQYKTFELIMRNYW